MAIDFMTADGLRPVRHWGYRLQGAGKGGKSHKLPIGELKLAAHDLLSIHNLSGTAGLWVAGMGYGLL